MPRGCLLRCIEAIHCLSEVSRSAPPGRRGNPLFVGRVTAASFREAGRPHRIDVVAAMGELRGLGAAYGLVVRRLTMLVHLLMSVQGATSGIPSPGAGPDGRAAMTNW
ncbi:hypothetical protein ZWY2020_010213 [Hordeum vulgare]|nr:hypothetical protein ZWY2020_010213 [Hordeum vulgare]